MDARVDPAPNHRAAAPTEQPGAGRRVGVLAVQGAFDAHRRVLARLGADVVEVRAPADLEGLDALVLPGGESTTMSKLLEFNQLLEPLERAVAGGLATLGTCAGMILLARGVLDGRPDQRSLGIVDIDVRRNAFGRQRDSFETDLAIERLGPPAFHAVFIRAPVVERVGAGVEVLASLPPDHGTSAPRPVLCRAGRVLVAAFHPELSGDERLHRLLLADT